MDSFGALLLWLANVQAFFALVGVLLLASVLFFAVVCALLLLQEREREHTFADFLDIPDEYHEEMLLKTVPAAWAESIHLLGAALREQQNAYGALKTQMEDYEEYVEAWAHETKIPLSLLTLLLDNRREELPETVAFKLDYIRNNMQEFIDQMLFYARLKAARKDYLLECINIGMCIEEVLEEYQPLLEEKQFKIIFSNNLCKGEYDKDIFHTPEEGLDFDSFTSEMFIEEDPDRGAAAYAYTDRRGIHFLLRQIVSNAIKYSAVDPELHFTFTRGVRTSILTIRDNGRGIPACDLPYIFEKGFTGGAGQDRKKATGMGLYLAKEIAGELGLTLEAKSEQGRYFEMDILFPVVKIPSQVPLSAV